MVFGRPGGGLTRSLFCEHSEPFLGTWPASGWMHAGSVYEPLMSAPLTPDSGCSSQPGHLLGTPRTSSSNGVGRYEESERGTRGRLEAQVDLLARALLPTPTATPYGNNQSPSPGASVRPSLDSLASSGALLPTPRASDGEKGGPNQKGSSGDLMLPSAVMRIGASTSPPSDAGN